MEKTTRGMLLGALMPVLIASVLTLVWSLFQADTKPPLVLIAVFFSIVLSVPISVLSTLILGVPSYLIFERLGIRSARAYLIWGIIFSVVLGALFVYPVGPENAAQRSGSILVFVVALFSGPAASFVFWKTVRPDLRVTENH